MDIQYLDLSNRSSSCLDHPLISILDILQEGKFERIQIAINERYVPLDGVTRIALILDYRVERVERLNDEIVVLELVKIIT